MSAAEDPIVIVIERERVRKIGHVGIAAAGLGAVAVGAAVAVYTSAILWSAAVANFILQWAIAIGLVAAVFAALYLGVRS
jgi:hypothetical protein